MGWLSHLMHRSEHSNAPFIKRSPQHYPAKLPNNCGLFEGFLLFLHFDFESVLRWKACYISHWILAWKQNWTPIGALWLYRLFHHCAPIDIYLAKAPKREKIEKKWRKTLTPPIIDKSIWQNRLSCMQLLHVVTDDARKLSASTQYGAYALDSRARIYPRNCVCVLLSHLSHPLKYRGFWGESKDKIVVTNIILLSHGEKWGKKRLHSIKTNIIPR